MRLARAAVVAAKHISQNKEARGLGTTSGRPVADQRQVELVSKENLPFFASQLGQPNHKDCLVASHPGSLNKAYASSGLELYQTHLDQQAALAWPASDPSKGAT